MEETAAVNVVADHYGRDIGVETNARTPTYAILKATIGRSATCAHDRG